MIDFTPELKALALRELEQYRIGPLFTPPSLRGTVMMPGLIGGAGWGGGAFDPERQTLYVKASNWPARIRVERGEWSDTVQAEYVFDRPPTLDVPTASLLDAPDAPSLPMHKPPYGTLTAIDMRTGEHRWQRTVGDTPSVRKHPLLKDLDLPLLGVSGAPGPIVTQGGLVFLTGGGETLYAFDADTGEMLWETDLGQRGYAVPMTYATGDGTQYVVIATGSGAEAVLKAFALP